MINVFIPKNPEEAMAASKQLALHLSKIACGFGIRTFTLNAVVDNPSGMSSPYMGTFMVTVHDGKIVGTRKALGGIVEVEEYEKFHEPVKEE